MARTESPDFPGGGPVLAQAGSFPQLGFSWQEIKVTTVFHNGSRQCETCVFTPAPHGEVICQDRSVCTQTQTEKRIHRSVSAGSINSKERIIRSTERKSPSRPSSSPAGRQKSQSRPSSVPAGKQKVQPAKRHLHESLHFFADEESKVQQSPAQKLPEQQMPDNPQENRPRLHSSSSHTSAAVSSSQANLPERTEGVQKPTHPRSKGSKSCPDVWDDLVYLGMVHLLPPRKDPKVWPTHLWKKIHLGLSKHAILYQINVGQAEKRVCELLIGLEPALVRRLSFPQESTQRFTVEIQPVEGDPFILACDEEGYLKDWIREINLLLFRYREGTINPRSSANADSATMSTSASTQSQSAALEESRVPAIEPAKGAATEATLDNRLVLPSKVTTKESSKLSARPQVVSNAGPAGQSLGEKKDKDAFFKAIAVARSVQNMRKHIPTRASIKPVQSFEDDTAVQDEVKMNELPRIAQTHQIPVSELQETWKEWLVFTQGRNEVPRDNFGQLLSIYLKIPLDKIPHHLLLKGVPRQRNSVILGEFVGFEEFALWRKTHEFDPFVSQNEEGRQLQALATEYDIFLTDVEAIKKQYNLFDADRSGRIEFDEFVSVVCNLLDIKTKEDLPHDRFQRYWSQVAGNEFSIGFKEFLPWYIQNFYGGEGDAISQFYASFGVNRLKNQ